MSVIPADAFFKALLQADVVRAGERIRRVVIDAQAGQAISVYVERFGDERLLNVALTLGGVEIRGVPAACTCPLVDVSVGPAEPSFVRGDPRGCPVHGGSRDAAIAEAERLAREAS